MNNYKAQLDNFKNKIEEKKLEKARLEERIKSLEEERNKILTELKTFNISTPEELENKIKNLELEIKTELIEIEKIIN